MIGENALMTFGLWKEKVPLFLEVTAAHLKHFLEISQMCFRSQLYICNVTSAEYFYLLPKLVFIAVSGARARKN